MEAEEGHTQGRSHGNLEKTGTRKPTGLLAGIVPGKSRPGSPVVPFLTNRPRQLSRCIGSPHLDHNRLQTLENKPVITYNQSTRRARAVSDLYNH